MIQLILHHVIPRPEVGGRSAEPRQRGRPREPRVVDGPQSVERPLAHNEEPLHVGTVSPATASSVVLRVYSSIDTSAPTIGVYPGVGTISRDVAIWCVSRRILRVTRHQSEAATRQIEAHAKHAQSSDRSSGTRGEILVRHVGDRRNRQASRRRRSFGGVSHPHVHQTSSKSRPRITRPRKWRWAASIQLSSGTLGSSAGTKCERTSVPTPAACATRPASSAVV